MKYWLMKSEPEVYSIDDLRREKQACWEGVRNYSARNNMMAMKKGDLAFFYHSNANPPGVAGVCRVWREAYPDHYSWDKKSKYFDEKSTKEKPRWYMVDVEFVKKFATPVSLYTIKATRGLEDMVLVRRGRLSVQPVSKKEWDRIMKMAG